jgi:very-long-chain (3R)-3-hydroxyacyl-CoA dehydratase
VLSYIVFFKQGKEVKKKKANPIINGYLILFNWASFFGWGYVLVEVVKKLIETNFDVTKVYPIVGQELIYVQTLALFEVVHALIGLVRTPIGTTVMQVASRILLTWGILHLFPYPQVRQHLAFTTMTIAWSITEVIRYSYYALNLMGFNPRFLVWCR